MKIRSGLIVVAAGLWLSALQAALAETIELHADMAGGNESPPNDAEASGAATVTYDTDNRHLTWHVEYQGLSGPAIGAHIHGPAAPGTNAGILIPFKLSPSPIEGSTTITQDQATELLAGKFYVNIHTERHPGGELRGQLTR